MTSPAASSSRPASLLPVEQAPEELAVADGASPCDLLHAVAFRRLDVEGARRQVSFAFSGGDVGDAFTRWLDKAELAPSGFVPEHFVDDVFLRELVSRCFAVKVQGHDRGANATHLYRLVCRPPREVEHARFRQAIFAELRARPELRRQLEKLHGFLTQLRDLMSRRGAVSPGSTELRLGILRAVRRVVELLVELEGCGSGLARLGAYGRQLAGLPSYRRLLELLAYESHRGEVDIRLRIGFDGRVRGFQALERRELASNPFYSTGAGRLWTRLWLLLRCVRAGMSELLSRLADEVFAGLELAVVFFFQLIGDLEFYLAGLGFAEQAERRGLATCLPELVADGMPRYERLFNPLLMAEGMAVVPRDLLVGGASPVESRRIVFVTGPNSGGKTRLLQALALGQLLGQAGLFVPAARAQLPWVSGLFASLVERVDPGQAEGRLGTELVRIRRLFECLTPGSLVLMDELCSGTNPSEGEELQELVVEMLGELWPHAFITTHFLQFAARLQATRSGLEFLRVELDAHERPTFAFVPGVASTSLAHRVAERLGVTREALRELVARSHSGAPPPGSLVPSALPPAPLGPAPSSRAPGRR